MPAQTFSFPAGKGRFQVYQRYNSGQPKTYKDKHTGRILTKAQKQAFEKDGFLPSMPELAMAGEMAGSPDVAPVERAARPVLLPPAMRPTTDEGAPDTSTGQDTGYVPDFTMPDPATGGSRKAGLFEAATPGVLTMLSSLAAWAAPSAPLLYLVPPPDLTAPVFVPLARIWDRHNPLGLAIEATEDGKDIMQSIAAASVCGYWIWHTIAEMRAAQAAQAQAGYLDANGNNANANANGNTHARAGRDTRGDGRAGGQSQETPVPHNSWLQSIAHGRGAGRDAGRADDGPSADYGGNGNADADNMVAGSGGKDTGWQAAAISDLFQVESVKRREKGLQ